MDSQQVRDVFLEALAETSATGDGGLFALVVYQLTGAIDITEPTLARSRSTPRRWSRAPWRPWQRSTRPGLPTMGSAFRSQAGTSGTAYEPPSRRRTGARDVGRARLS
jgi:hypothetical protein